MPGYHPMQADKMLRANFGAGLLKFGLVPLWLFAYWPALAWLLEKSARLTEALPLQLAACGGLAVLLIQGKIDARLYARRPALALLLAASAAGLLNAKTIALPQAQAGLFLLGAYAWLGLNRSAVYWGKGLSYALLSALLLPFYLEFSSGLGFGLRLLTAAWVGDSLAAFGYAALSAHDVIIAENAVAHVDLPCSGLKSLWVGSGFFITAAALLGVRLTAGVALKYLLFLGLLLSANALRILLLTLAASVYHWPDLAAALHRPLGLLGFGVCCAVAWRLLSRSPKLTARDDAAPVAWKVATPCLMLVIGIATLQGATVQRQDTGMQQLANEQLALPAQLHPSALPLTEAEARYFARTPQTRVTKWRIDMGQRSGSVLLVQSRDFNAFHAPELCLAAGGTVVDRMQSLTLAPDLHVRLLSLQQGKANGIYWLQSGAATTDDFLHRYWRYLRAERDWRLVFIVLDTPDPAPLQALAQLIYTYQRGERHAMAIAD